MCNLIHSRFEREVSAERVRDKIAASKKKGMWMGGHPPLGYDIVDRKLVVNPAEAETVRHIFRRFLEIGSATLLVKELQEQGVGGKKWVSATGREFNCRIFDKGSLYKLLNSRVALGEVVHKGQVYPGEHEAIIDRATWDQVQAIFASNSHERSAMTRRQSPAVLKGLVHCRHCHHVMTPSHSRKNGRLYRYYLCTSAAKNGHEACPMPSIPAGEVEGMVRDHLRAIIHSPEMAVRTWRSANDDHAIPEREVLETLRNLDAVWDQLFPAEQARLTQLLVSKVAVGGVGIDLYLRTDGLESLVQELSQPVNDQPERKRS